MSKVFIPTTPDAITPEWLSDVLGAPIANVDKQMVGTGQMGDSVRLTLTYDGEKGRRRSSPSCRRSIRRAEQRRPRSAATRSR